MSCVNIPWEKGYNLGLKQVGPLAFPLNYFSCGKYFFDGYFNVVEFPAGVSIYHGSKALPKANVRFPVGIPFYQPHKYGSRSSVPDVTQQVINSSDSTVEEILSEYLPVAPVWFANPETSHMYGGGSPKNMFAFKFNKPSKFLILDDNSNIAKILFEPGVPDSIKTYLRLMFTLPNNVAIEPSDSEYGKIKFAGGKVRQSVYSWDRAFAEWICKAFPDTYAGYCADVQVHGANAIFHLEFMSCNPFKHIERDLGNVIDWQYNPMYSTPSPAGDILHQYVEQLSYYTTTNVDFHSGNLLEHSVWCLLFAEDLMRKRIGKLYKVDHPELKRAIAAAAFIHDIGKMAPWECTKREHDLVFYSVKTHPKIGKDYVNGTIRLPIFTRNMEETGDYLDMKKLLNTLGVSDNNFMVVADLVGHHWDFGTYLRAYTAGDSKAADNFINFIGRDRTFDYFHALLIVSMADVMAAQPFIGKNGENVKSEFYPVITNLPKRYRGNNLAVMQAVAREEFATIILNKVYSDKFNTTTPQPKVSFENIKRTGEIMKRETLADLEQMEIDNVNAIGMKEDEIVQKQQKLFASRDKNKQKRQALVQKLAEIDMEGESIIREIGAIVNNVEMLEQKRQTDDVKRLVENMDVEIPEELMDTD
jgi:hypothetical protein